MVRKNKGGGGRKLTSKRQESLGTVNNFGHGGGGNLGEGQIVFRRGGSQSSMAECKVGM